MMVKTNKSQIAHRKRIGIYAGTFDPVHAGHIAFALQAMQTAQLDSVIFLPERCPRNKSGVEHFGHRVAMLNRALLPHPHFSVLELVDRQFSIAKTLPTLQSLWPNAQLVFLTGSDTAFTMQSWPHLDRLFLVSELVIGVRSSSQLRELTGVLAAWPKQPLASYIVMSYAADVSSSHIRTALRTSTTARGLLASVQRYARQEWLYASPLSATNSRLIV